MNKKNIIALSLLAAPAAFAGEAGKLTQEIWSNLSGEYVSDLTSSPRYLTTADSVTSIDGAQSVVGSLLGARLRGYVTIPETGTYRFAVAGDNTALLKIAVDGNKFNSEEVASVPTYTSLTDWTASPTQISQDVELVAGQRIFVEALLKASRGFNGVAIGWVKPGTTEVEQIPASALESYVFAEDANDTDGNELPDNWATLPADANGAGDDTDNDGYLNIEEYQFGTDPLVHGGVPGYLSYDKWTGFGASSVASLTSLPEFRLRPDSSELIAGAEAPVNEGGNFGARLHGYVIAPADGEYTFWVAGDNQFELHLSTDESKFNAVKVAEGTRFTSVNNFDANPSQKSEGVTLVAGQKYYICGLMKESGGGDHLSIAWTTPDGQREIIPASALESYAYDADDADNDGMKDSWELANGLDTSVNDALADPDGDNAPNWLEFQAGANPQDKAPVVGGLVHELWNGVSGRFVSDLTTSAKFLQTPDVKSISTWSAGPFRWGANHGNRLRGYITPTESGTYYFWAEGDKQVDFRLSTDADKFNAVSLIKTTYWNTYNGFDFDYNLAQKSKAVYLKAGQSYYIEVLHKSTTSNDHFSFAWTKPDGTREMVPAEFLSTFAGQENDKDDDGLLDSYELANGLSITDNGSVNPANGAAGDLDGDGLTNAEEQVAGTFANNGDTDNDGVSDFDEVNVLNTKALVGDVAPFVEVASISGFNFTNPVGEWVNSDGKALHTTARGSVDYTVTVSKDGIYMLDLELAPYSGASLSDEYEVVYSVDGQKLERVIVNAAEGETTNAKALTPFLKAGEHTVTVFLDNSYTYRKATLNTLKVLAAAGNDSNSNGQPDWVENRLAAANTVDGGVLYSKTSPAFIEGKAQYLDLAYAGGVPMRAAPGNRWFANVDLNPSGEIDPLSFSFENGGQVIDKEFKWLTTNLLEEERIRVRQWSSLRLSATELVEGSADESVALQIADRNYSFTADQPQVVEFTQPGEHTIDVTYTSESGTQTKQVIVEVLVGYGITEEPVVVQDYWRQWDLPALPENATVEFDERLIVREAEELANGSVRYTLSNTGSENLPAIVRDEVSGEVIGSFNVRGLRVRENELTGAVLVGQNEDDSINVEMPVIIDGALSQVTLQYDIVIGGVTFDDGLIVKTWAQNELATSDGTINLMFRKYGNHGSVCHRGSIWQNGERVAHMY